MIRVTVELLRHGNEDDVQHLGTCVIANDGSGDWQTGNYDVDLSKWGRPGHTWRKGRVVDFPRRRLGPWDLLYRALRATVGHRNEDV